MWVPQLQGQQLQTSFLRVTVWVEGELNTFHRTLGWWGSYAWQAHAISLVYIAIDMSVCTHADKVSA
jgi:hypothetical protein